MQSCIEPISVVYLAYLSRILRVSQSYTEPALFNVAYYQLVTKLSSLFEICGRNICLSSLSGAPR